MKPAKLLYIIFTLFCNSYCLASNDDDQQLSGYHSQIQKPIQYTNDESISHTIGNVTLIIKPQAIQAVDHFMWDSIHIGTKIFSYFMGYQRQSLVEQAIQLPRYLTLALANKDMLADAFDYPSSESINYATLMAFHATFDVIELIVSMHPKSKFIFPGWGLAGLMPMIAGGTTMAMLLKLYQNNLITLEWNDKKDK